MLRSTVRHEGFCRPNKPCCPYTPLAQVQWPIQHYSANEFLCIATTHKKPAAHTHSHSRTRSPGGRTAVQHWPPASERFSAAAPWCGAAAGAATPSTAAARCRAAGAAPAAQTPPAAPPASWPAGQGGRSRWGRRRLAGCSRAHPEGVHSLACSRCSRAAPSASALQSVRASMKRRAEELCSTLHHPPPAAAAGPRRAGPQSRGTPGSPSGRRCGTPARLQARAIRYMIQGCGQAESGGAIGPRRCFFAAAGRQVSRWTGGGGL